jgi:hypothetical protein
MSMLSFSRPKTQTLSQRDLLRGAGTQELPRAARAPDMDFLPIWTSSRHGLPPDTDFLPTRTSSRYDTLRTDQCTDIQSRIPAPATRSPAPNFLPVLEALHQEPPTRDPAFLTNAHPSLDPDPTARRLCAQARLAPIPSPSDDLRTALFCASSALPTSHESHLFLCCRRSRTTPLPSLTTSPKCT